jgi:amino acid transporter
MKKIILKNGLWASAIVVLFMAISTYLWKTDPDFKPTALFGFASMFLAFTFIFIGIKNFRDNVNNGVLSFWQGFKIGALIALIASTFYVVAWLFMYYNFLPNFMELYEQMVLEEAKVAGETAAQIKEKLAEIHQYKEWYKSPFLIVLLTYMEILPLGLIIALLCALILKRKVKN